MQTNRGHKNHHFQKKKKNRWDKDNQNTSVFVVFIRWNVFNATVSFRWLQTHGKSASDWLTYIFRTPLSGLWLVEGGLFCAIWRIRHFLKKYSKQIYGLFSVATYSARWLVWVLEITRLSVKIARLGFRAGRQEEHKGGNCRKSRTFVWLSALKVSSVNAQASCRLVEHASLLVTIPGTAFVLKKSFIYRWGLFLLLPSISNRASMLERFYCETDPLMGW